MRLFCGYPKGVMSKNGVIGVPEHEIRVVERINVEWEGIEKKQVQKGAKVRKGLIQRIPRAQ